MGPWDEGWQQVCALPRGPGARPHWGHLGWSRAQGAAWGVPQLPSINFLLVIWGESKRLNTNWQRH